MPFSKFLLIVLSLLGAYYLITILLDLARGSTKKVLDSNNDIHKVQFEETDDPVVVTDISDYNDQLKKKSIMNKDQVQTHLDQDEDVDMNLEVVSGDPMILTAENIAKAINFK